MSTSSNKRKSHDAFGATREDAERSPLAPRKDAARAATKDQHHLPAEVWGHVLDYMSYDEVRSALLVGKVIANEAVDYVQRLNIMKSC